MFYKVKNQKQVSIIFYLLTLKSFKFDLLFVLKITFLSQFKQTRKNKSGYNIFLGK